MSEFSYKDLRNQLISSHLVSKEPLPSPTRCFLVSMNCGEIYFWPGNLKRILAIAKQMGLNMESDFCCSLRSRQEFENQQQRIIFFMAEHEFGEKRDLQRLGSFITI